MIIIVILIKNYDMSLELKNQIPPSLIKETIDGIPFYYAGYKSVLNQTRKLEEIMPDSGLQAIIKNLLKDFLTLNLDRKLYWILIGEVGSHLNKRSNMGLDIAIYDKKVLTADKITNKYIDVAPKLVIEVDVNVEMADTTSNLFEEFVLRKVKNLHKFGTEKVVWLFTKSKTVIVAYPDGTWKVLDWDKEIELIDGVKCNIDKYLKEEGINF